jgi:GDP-D-mannose dehydratase
VRGETFVTRKSRRGLARIKAGPQNSLLMSNLNSLPEWGHARDCAEMQWLIRLQEKELP